LYDSNDDEPSEVHSASPIISVKIQVTDNLNNKKMIKSIKGIRIWKSISPEEWETVEYTVTKYLYDFLGEKYYTKSKFKDSY
jgi:hypothetical protein